MFLSQVNKLLFVNFAFVVKSLFKLGHLGLTFAPTEEEERLVDLSKHHPTRCVEVYLLY